MSGSTVWFVTGAAKGMGHSFVTSALAAGHAVVATGRRPNEITTAFGERDDLLALRLDVTSGAESNAAADAAVERFGRIDVLVNNAGASFKGYFEEMSPRQVEQQLATNLLGPMNVTRAVLPVMRRQRSGHVISISSGAGLMAFEYSSVYAASKFGLEGWMTRVGSRGRSLRHLHDDRQSGVLPDELGQSRVIDLAGTVDRRLRRAQRRPTHLVGGARWATARRS